MKTLEGWRWLSLLLILCLSTPTVAQPAKIIDLKDREFSADEVKRALAPEAASSVGSSARRTRGLGVVSAGAIAGLASPPPKLSMQLQFAFDSAEITEQAKTRLNALGEALQSPELASDRFIVSGHTDAAGKYDYNLGLSKRRAEAVKSYLVAKHGVAPDRIIPAGRASDELIDQSDPRAAANRRVQVEVMR